jgi:hypothetical protein
LPNLLQLSAPTIDDLRQKVRDEHGPLARIVSAEKVIPRGIGRVRKPAYFEAVVELPDAPPTPPDVQVDPAARHGIAALLADADDAEDAAGTAPAPTHFDQVMASLGGFAAPPAPTPPVSAAPAFAMPPVFPAPLELEAARAPLAVPVPPSVPGDLVVVVSLGPDALTIAQAMCKSFGPGELRGGGTIKARGRVPLADRRSALLARADGVENGRVVFCAFGVDATDDGLGALAAIDADQVWIVVDAGRKTDDTQRWLQRIASVVEVAAVAVLGAASTATPHTVNALGLPIGWVDGAPAATARL